MAGPSKKQVLRSVEKFMRGKQTSAGGTGRAGSKVSYTNLAKDLDGITDELAKKVCPTAVAAAATIVRKEAVKIVRSGSRNSPSSSKKTKTRGVPPLRRISSGNVTMTNAGKGAWWGKELINRRGGPNGPSLGAPGTIIKKRIERKGYGLHSSQKVGPRYEKSPKGKNFAHTHEPKSGSTGAPGHKWWGQPAKRPLKARPFMGPAGENTIPAQRRVIKRTIQGWKMKRPDLA